MEGNSSMKIIGLIWILVECCLVAGNIFGFASLFSVFPRYGIYEWKCSANNTLQKKGCPEQIAEYQLAFALGIGFYNLPAVIVGMINDYFGPRTLKLMAIVFHLISWLSLGFTAPGRDWLIFFHTIFLSFAGICTLLSAVSISAHFTQRRGLVTSLISGAQLTGSIWYAIFQILIDREIISLSTLSFIWASFAILMLGSAFLFLDWRFAPIPSTLKTKPPAEVNKEEVKVITSTDKLTRHLSNPLFILVTLFLSCLILIISFLPIIWFPWLLYLTGNNLALTDWYTFLYNMSAALGIVFAPLCGLILDYKAYQGYIQKMLNISILQTLTWISSVALCIVCMFQTLTAAIVALIIFTFARPILVAGSQALVAAVFPPRFIGSLLGVMWTTVGIISFSTYALVRLAHHPTIYWRGWAVILGLCLIVVTHLIQVWMLYLKSKRARGNRQPSVNQEEVQAFTSN